MTEESDDDREKVSEEEKRKKRKGACYQVATRNRGPHAPKKIEEPEHLDQHADSRPFEEDKKDSTEETGRPTQLVLTREKVECLLRANDEEKAAQEEDLCAARKVNQSCGMHDIVGGNGVLGMGRGEEKTRTFPRARRAPSKKSMMPSIMKSAPNDVSPTPISKHHMGWSIWQNWEEAQFSY